MTTATMTSKGQITIPADIRKKLRLKAGTKVDFAQNENGEIVLKPKIGDIRKLYGIVKYKGLPLTIEQMNEAIKKGASERFNRSVE
jgi:antitoxin PrlF